MSNKMRSKFVFVGIYYDSLLQLCIYIFSKINQCCIATLIMIAENRYAYSLTIAMERVDVATDVTTV